MQPRADPGEVRVHLVAAAKAGVALSYGELLEHLGYSFSRPKMRQLCVVLGTVDAEAELRGEPGAGPRVFQAPGLFYRQRDGCQGGGRQRGYDGPWEGPEAARFIAAVQAETFAFWQSRNETGTAKAAD